MDIETVCYFTLVRIPYLLANISLNLILPGLIITQPNITQYYISIAMTKLEHKLDITLTKDTWHCNLMVTL